MSTNRLNSTKRRLDELLIKKDLTPKNKRLSPKISPVYSSFRGGLTMKSDLTAKPKATRPLTSKNSSDGGNYFRNKD